MYWSGLVSDQLFFDHSLFYPFAGAGDSGAVTLQGATAYPMIFICSKQSPIDRESIFTQVKSLDFPYPNVREVIKQSGSILPVNAIAGSNWLLTNNGNASRIKQMELVGTSLGEYVKGKVYRGVTTGFNEAFFIDSKTRDRLISEDSASEEIIKPLLAGKDIVKWHIKDKNQYLIFTRRGINIDEYPAIKKYLSQWQTRLEPKPRNWDDSEKWGGRKAGSYKWYEIQDEVTYYSAFDRPKIVFPDIAKESRFTFDPDGKYLLNTAYCIPTNDFYLLGVLKSSTTYNYILSMNSEIRGGYLRFIRQYVEKIMIPQASEIERKAISKLVQKCLDAKGVGCEQWEREIDEIVAGLYGFASETPPLDAKSLGFGKGIQQESGVAVLAGKTGKSKQPANTSASIESHLN